MWGQEKGRHQMQATLSPQAKPRTGGLPALETSAPILERTQAYLKALLRRQAPDTVLTEAWEQFYRVYSELIRRFIVARGLRGADVEDCVQDVWTEVAKRLADFRRPRNRPGLRAWLYTLVRSKATDLIRRKIRHAAGSLAEEIRAGNEPIGDELDPADAYERHWARAMLQTALAGLRHDASPLSYRVLHMRLMEDRSVAEVAAALGLTPARVRYRHHRMLRKLRTRLAVFVGKPFGEDAHAASVSAEIRRNTERPSAVHL